jgi:3''-deamino-3''-oxonicotianamine reductase
MASAAATTGGTHSSKIPNFPAGPDRRLVPAVGLGTSTYPPVAEDSIRAAVLTALQLGYRHLDTAALYGSERAVGEAVLEAARSGVVASREEVFVTTKVWCTQCHPELVIPSLRESLQ